VYVVVRRPVSWAPFPYTTLFRSQRRCRVVYISPLKALAFDIERNLRAPLAGIRQAATRLRADVPDITVGMRTGDTSTEERRAFRSEEHTSELQSLRHLVCRLLLE